jgi:hypothetical protein
MVRIDDGGEPEVVLVEVAADAGLGQLAGVDRVDLAVAHDAAFERQPVHARAMAEGRRRPRGRCRARHTGCRATGQPPGGRGQVRLRGQRPSERNKGGGDRDRSAGDGPSSGGDGEVERWARGESQRDELERGVIHEDYEMS